MNIHDYITDGGKNLIKEYISGLPKYECTYGYAIRHKIIKDGLNAFNGLDTRQLYKKLWEIKFFDNRIMYVMVDDCNVYFLHACRKQKGKAEKFEIDKAKQRASELNLL